MNMALHAPTSATVFNAVAGDLKALGIESAFGLMSDDTALLINAMEDQGIRFIGSRHENNAVAMAEGYARAAGRLGVAVIGRGPGLANCINALVHVSRTGTPLLVIMGDAAHARGGPNAFGPDYKQLDGQPLVTAAGIQTFKATGAGSARASLAEAAAAAAQGRTVVFHLPMDVQNHPAVPAEIPPAVRAAAAPRPARDAAVDIALDLLAKARRPVIIAGWGAYISGARTAIETMADRVGALLTTSLRAKDLFRGNPYEVGIAGSFSTSVARRHVDQADCIIVIGAGLNMLTTAFGEFFPRAPLIQIDADRSSIGRFCFADVALVGDARLVVEQLLARLPERSDGDKPYHCTSVREEIAQFDHHQDFKEAHTDWSVDMRSLALALDTILPDDRDLIYDMGNFFAVAPYIGVPDPGCLRYTGEFGSIGLGFGTALGVAAAGRPRPTCLMIGDGALLMTLGELETMAREDLPMVIIVFNDHSYGAERHYLALRDQPFAKSVFPQIEFGPIAESFGITSFSIKRMSDLETARDAIRAADGPILIDCQINPAIPAPFLTEFARLEHGE